MAAEETIQKSKNSYAEVESSNSNRIENGIKEETKKRKDSVDPELFSCLLQPASSDLDPEYIGIRRLLLYTKADSGALLRADWRCNRKGYVSYRNYIRRPRNWETSQIPSLQSTPGNRLLKVYLIRMTYKILKFTLLSDSRRHMFN
uniref:Transducin family protein n=1 Tax=Rhizophora mucronata TaxID=61149 RepID=A0A2P2KW13_RHIMU